MAAKLAKIRAISYTSGFQSNGGGEHRPLAASGEEGQNLYLVLCAPHSFHLLPAQSRWTPDASRGDQLHHLHGSDLARKTQLEGPGQEPCWLASTGSTGHSVWFSSLRPRQTDSHRPGASDSRNEKGPLITLRAPRVSGIP